MRHFYKELAEGAVKLLPGEYFASGTASAVTTLLGSCVSVCLYDRIAGVGGMNHFMLPEPPGAREEAQHSCAACASTPACALGTPRYGRCAMNMLLQRLQELGGMRSRLEAKLFGGGRVMAGGADIGEKNASFALHYLKERKIPVVSSDLGDGTARRVLFLTATGQAFVKRVRAAQGDERWP